jgi:uncharacterized protein YuzE
VRYTFDAPEGLLYIYFADDLAVADLDSDGRVVGLEVINLDRWVPATLLGMLDESARAYLQAVALIFGPAMAVAPSDPAFGTARAPVLTSA